MLLINIAIACIVLFLIGYIVLKRLDKYTNHGYYITVPELRGFTPDEAESFAKDKNLQILVIDSIYDNHAKPGTIVEQFPSPNAHVKNNRAIQLTINANAPEKIIFPIVVSLFVILLLPSTAPLIGCLMLGNLWRECGVTARLSDTVQNALMNIVTVFLGISVGATTVASSFLSLQTLYIVGLGLLAFCFSTIGGLLVGKLMYKLSGGKINPLIGSAGVSAVPMAARVSQIEGQKANPSNFLLMHAMGPNVAGVIGSAIAAGFLLAVFG